MADEIYNAALEFYVIPSLHAQITITGNPIARHKALEQMLRAVKAELARTEALL